MLQEFARVLPRRASCVVDGPPLLTPSRRLGPCLRPCHTRQDVEEGGGTRFTKLGLTVRPKKGRVLLWHNVMLDDPAHELDERMNHEAQKVTRGPLVAMWFAWAQHSADGGLASAEGDPWAMTVG